MQLSLPCLGKPQGLADLEWNNELCFRKAAYMTMVFPLPSKSATYLYNEKHYRLPQQKKINLGVIYDLLLCFGFGFVCLVWFLVLLGLLLFLRQFP